MTLSCPHLIGGNSLTYSPTSMPIPDTLEVRDPLSTMTREEAVAFFAGIYGREGRIPSPVYKFGSGWRVFVSDTVDTFDSTLMTRLVWASYRYAVRVEIQASTPGNLNICIWGRPDRSGRPAPSPLADALRLYDEELAVGFDLGHRDRGPVGEF